MAKNKDMPQYIAHELALEQLSDDGTGCELNYEEWDKFEKQKRGIGKSRLDFPLE